MEKIMDRKFDLLSFYKWKSNWEATFLAIGNRAFVTFGHTFEEGFFVDLFFFHIVVDSAFDFEVPLDYWKK